MYIISYRAPPARSFLYNADTQRALTRHADTLLAALQFFNGALATLTARTMDDTLLTVRQYEAARYRPAGVAQPVVTRVAPVQHSDSYGGHSVRSYTFR